MIRSLLTSLKSVANLLGATAMGCVLATGGLAQAQSGTAPKLLGPTVQPIVTAPVSPTIAIPEAPTFSAPASAPAPAVQIFDPMVRPASGCASCGTAPRGDHYGRSNTTCVPGRPCHLDFGDSACGRMFAGLCEELCCPDPCYEPRWIPEANAAFFQDGPRPVSQSRIRWDAGYDYRFPDSAEYFMAQNNKKGVKFNIPSLRYNDLTLYTEIAASKTASFFTEIGYLNYQPDGRPGASGFGDMNLGTKVVMLDRELLLMTFQFKTFIPTGNFTAGVGSGHTALEPALLTALKLGPVTYLQTELAEWIPIGGTPGFSSSVFHYHFSLNHNLCHWGDCLNLIGVLELNGWTYNGAATDAFGNIVGNSGGTYANAGPGLRLQICDHFDVGLGTGFGFGNHHGPGSIYRTEIRVRY